jgi:hypothetical protein
MKNNKRGGSKTSVGIFLDGKTLQIVSLAKEKYAIRLVDAQLIELSKRPESVVDKPIFAEEIHLDEQNGNTLDLTDELNSPDVEFDESEPAEEEPTSDYEILENELQKLAHKKYKIGISVAEPEIYYASFSSDWGLEGDKLKEKIIENLIAEKPTALNLVQDDVKVIRPADNSVLAAVRGDALNVLHLLETSRRHLGNRMPKISFVETAEISLVNLVKANYEFKEDAHTVIVYIGQEFSRLVFLLGNNLANISQIIGEGIDSPEIANTIYSRLLLELDNLNLNSVDSIILAGEADAGNVHPFLREKFSLDVNIDFFKFSSMDVNNIDSVLSRFAIAVGVAWRALEEREDFYEADFLPKEVREKQKIFKLGIAGWILLFMLPLLAFFFTSKTLMLQNELKGLGADLKNKQNRLEQLQIPQQELAAANIKIDNYNTIFGVLDSMLIGTKTWSHFLQKVAAVNQNVKRIWVTNIRSASENKVTLEGYALYRNRIPVFANALGNATLIKVEVQEIREKTVYYFELEVELTPK